MAASNGTLEIWYPSMDEVSIFTEVNGEGAEREIIEAMLFASFTAEMITALGKTNFAKEHLCDTLWNMGAVDIDALHMGALKIVPATASKGRKGFEGKLFVAPQNVRMKVKPKGFGALGRTVDFYAPLASLALFLQLYRRQSPHGQAVLTKTAQAMGWLGNENMLNNGTKGPRTDDAVMAAIAEVDEAADADAAGE